MDEKDRQQRLAVADAAAELQGGRRGRRSFLRLCAQAGFGFSSFAFSSGCGKKSRETPSPQAVAGTAGPVSAVDPLTEQHRFLRDVGRRFAGTKLRVVGEDTSPSGAIVEMMREEFISVTGIEVQWERLPLERVLAKVTADTARGVGTHDIFYWDQAWLGRFADDAVDPRTLLERRDLAYPGYDFADFLPPLVDRCASYKGRLLGVPFDIPIFHMMYRRDLFEELGLSPPTTLAEYLRAAQTITKAKAPKVFGTTGEWKSGHYSLECDMTVWLWAHGGSIFGADGRPTIGDERAAAALEYMLELGKNSPPGVTTWDWFGAMGSVARGEAGLVILWSELFPAFEDPAKSKIVGLLEPASCPKEITLRSKQECGFDETPGMSHQGGSCLAISRHSKNVDAAWLFLQWATSADVATRACLLGGGSGTTRRSIFSDPRVKEKARVTTGTTRHYDVLLDAILHRMGTEPHLPSFPELATEGFAVELGKLTTRQQGVKETLDNMARAAAKAAQPR
ncbi:MAG TPA: extracellular solute-binding protein [Polyangiaceae bacterium]|nr:extracellular solute-binding protein [Polyangiaceae bacterium]